MLNYLKITARDIYFLFKFFSYNFKCIIYSIFLLNLKTKFTLLFVISLISCGIFLKIFNFFREMENKNLLVVLFFENREKYTERTKN